MIINPMNNCLERSAKVLCEDTNCRKKQGTQQSHCDLCFPYHTAATLHQGYLVSPMFFNFLRSSLDTIRELIEESRRKIQGGKVTECVEIRVIRESEEVVSYRGLSLKQISSCLLEQFKDKCKELASLKHKLETEVNCTSFLIDFELGEPLSPFISIQKALRERLISKHPQSLVYTKIYFEFVQHIKTKIKLTSSSLLELLLPCKFEKKESNFTPKKKEAFPYEMSTDCSHHEDRASLQASLTKESSVHEFLIESSLKVPLFTHFESQIYSDDSVQDDASQKLKKLLEKSQENTKVVEGQLELAREEIRALNFQLSSARAEINRHESNIEQLNGKSTLMETEFLLLKKRSTLMEAQMQELERDMSRQRDQCIEAKEKTYYMNPMYEKDARDEDLLEEVIELESQLMQSRNDMIQTMDGVSEVLKAMRGKDEQLNFKVLKILKGVKTLSKLDLQGLLGMKEEESTNGAESNSDFYFSTIKRPGDTTSYGKYAQNPF